MSQNNDFDLDSFMEDAGIAEPGTKRPVKLAEDTTVEYDSNSNEDVNIDDLSDGWVPDEALDALIDEKIKNPNQTYALPI